MISASCGLFSGKGLDGIQGRVEKTVLKGGRPSRIFLIR